MPSSFIYPKNNPRDLLPFQYHPDKHTEKFKLLGGEADHPTRGRGVSQLTGRASPTFTFTTMWDSLDIFANETFDKAGSPGARQEVVEKKGAVDYALRSLGLDDGPTATELLDDLDREFDEEDTDLGVGQPVADPAVAAYQWIVRNIGPRGRVAADTAPIFVLKLVGQPMQVRITDVDVEHEFITRPVGGMRSPAKVLRFRAAFTGVQFFDSVVDTRLFKVVRKRRVMKRKPAAGKKQVASNTGMIGRVARLGALSRGDGATIVKVVTSLNLSPDELRRGLGGLHALANMEEADAAAKRETATARAVFESFDDPSTATQAAIVTAGALFTAATLGAGAPAAAGVTSATSASVASYYAKDAPTPDTTAADAAQTNADVLRAVAVDVDRAAAAAAAAAGTPYTHVTAAPPPSNPTGNVEAQTLEAVFGDPLSLSVTETDEMSQARVDEQNTAARVFGAIGGDSEATSPADPAALAAANEQVMSVLGKVVDDVVEGGAKVLDTVTEFIDKNPREAALIAVGTVLTGGIAAAGIATASTVALGTAAAVGVSAGIAVGAASDVSASLEQSVSDASAPNPTGIPTETSTFGDDAPHVPVPTITAQAPTTVTTDGPTSPGEAALEPTPSAPEPALARDAYPDEAVNAATPGRGDLDGTPSDDTVGGFSRPILETAPDAVETAQYPEETQLHSGGVVSVLPEATTQGIRDVSVTAEAYARALDATFGFTESLTTVRALVDPTYATETAFPPGSAASTPSYSGVDDPFPPTPPAAALGAVTESTIALLNEDEDLSDDPPTLSPVPLTDDDNNT